MAKTRCVKCGVVPVTFELVPIMPTAPRLKLFGPSYAGSKPVAVQCAACGTTIGVSDFLNIKELMDKLEEVAGRLDRIERRLPK